MALHTLGNQTSRLEEILSPKPIKNSNCSNTLMIKPPPNLRKEKFLLSSKKDDDFMEGLISRLQKISLKGKERIEEMPSISVITKEENFSSEKKNAG